MQGAETLMLPTLPATGAACCASLGTPSLSDEQAQATARLFKALAEGKRLAEAVDALNALGGTWQLATGQPPTG
jgi:hypothetical protein